MNQTFTWEMVGLFHHCHPLKIVCLGFPKDIRTGRPFFTPRTSKGGWLLGQVPRVRPDAALPRSKWRYGKSASISRCQFLVGRGKGVLLFPPMFHKKMVLINDVQAWLTTSLFRKSTVRSQMISLGCPITETKRIVCRFHETFSEGAIFLKGVQSSRENQWGGFH